MKLLIDVPALPAKKVQEYLRFSNDPRNQAKPGQKPITYKDAERILTKMYVDVALHTRARL